MSALIPSAATATKPHASTIPRASLGTSSVSRIWNEPRRRPRPPSLGLGPIFLIGVLGPSLSVHPEFPWLALMDFQTDPSEP